MRFIASLAAVAALTASPAAAEIQSRSDDSFTLSFSQRVTATPEAIYARIGDVGSWWSGEHSYSGRSANLSLELKPGGCWCETLPDGGVKHAEVLLAWPTQRLLRLDAPFGPLQDTATFAMLTMTWKEAEGGGARMLTWTYRVEGAGTGRFADAVHGVMQTQFANLTNRLNAPG